MSDGDAAAVRDLPPDRRRADIEGLRGVAILLVVAYHAGIPFASGGFVGVDAFFALSGYLIAGQLWRELHRTGTIDFRAFYARRVRRLLPAAALMLLATMLAARLLLGPLEQSLLVAPAMATTFYVSNLWFAREATDYLGAPAESNPLLHTWSLSVEEQFYLAWPVLLWLGWRFRRGSGLIAVTAAVTLVSAVLMIRYNNISHPWTFYGSHTRAWEFGAGALAALILWNPPAGLTRVGGWLGLGLLTVAAVTYDARTPFPGVTTAVPVAGTLLVLVCADARAAAALSTLRPFGRVSYSWYLWHWPAIVFALTLIPELGVWGRLAAAGASLVIAVLAQALIEDPVRYASTLRERPALSLALAAAITLALAGVTAVWSRSAADEAQHPGQARYLTAREDYPAIAVNGCHQTVESSALTACVDGSPESPTRIVLFGDSHAAQWFPALERLAASRGWALHSLTKMGCPVPEIAVTDACKAWRAAAVARIGDLQPAFVFAASASLYLGDSGTLAGVSEAAWRDGTRRALSSLSGRRTILIADLPQPGFDPALCLARRAWHRWFASDCGFDPTAVSSVARASAIERDVAAGYAHVRTIDLSDAVCAGTRCESMQNDVIRFRDGNHITATFSAALWPTLATRVDALAW